MNTNEQLLFIVKKCIEANHDIAGVCGNHDYHHDDCLSCRFNARNPRLADVLITVCKHKHNWLSTNCVEGDFLGKNSAETVNFIAMWNKRDDDLKLQSYETIDFIYELLK